MVRKATGSSFGSIGELPETIDLGEFPNMHGEDRSKDPPLVKINKMLEDMFQGFQRGFGGSTPTHWADVLRSYFMTRRLVFWYFGGHDFLANVDRHPYADLIAEALRSYLQNRLTLQQLVPALRVNIDDEELRILADHLGQLITMERDDKSINEGFDRLRANLEDRVYQVLKVVFELSKHAVPTHLTLNEHLRPLMDLFTKGGQEALERRKANDKVVGATEDRVIGAVKKALETPKAPPPTPAAPTPPAVDLNTLKSARNRARGRGRDTE